MAIGYLEEDGRLSVRAQPAELRFVSGAYLRCPNCNSTDLKKVSLAYQEGLFDTAARTRLRAVAVGGCVLLAAIAAG
jgi:hypothetical protein